MKCHHRTVLPVVLSLISLSSAAIRNIKFASPLQALTLWDPETKEEASQVGPTPRLRFLFKFQAGLSAEREVKRQLEEQRSGMEVADTTSDWADQAAAADFQNRAREDLLMGDAYDQAVATVDGELKRRQRAQNRRLRNANKYQFVGVVQRPSDPTAVKWYARPKPAGAKWSLRLLHVNREAIVKDLYDQGKIDIFARYKNTGVVDEKTQQPIVECDYSVKERNWKNAWNFSPKGFLTDSSGMYWRERRLSPGLYTDGKTVFESSYRYDDGRLVYNVRSMIPCSDTTGTGRNGMHRLSSFQQFLSSPSVDDEQKRRILSRLVNDDPDVVLE